MTHLPFFVTLSLCAAALAACSSDAATPADAAPVDVASADVAPDAPADAPPACPAHTHETAPRECDADLTFAESTPLPVARDHHGAVIAETPAGPRLIVVGGAVLPPGAHDQTTTSNVSIAPIAADGSIGAWSDGPALPGGRGGEAIGLVGDTVIVVGGRNTGFLRSSALATVQPDGTLGEWIAGPSIPEGRFHISGAVSGRWMYASGGLAMRAGNATEARPEVYGARLGDDGTLGAWQAMTPLPEPISHHASFVHEGWLFVAGGLGGDPFNSHDMPRLTVYRARIADDGTLGAWEPVNQLPGWISTHAAAVHGGRVYLFGGVADDSDNSDQILRARLMPGGALGAWEAWSTTLPTARAHLHYVPVRDGRAYFVSGSMMPHTPVPTTWVGTFR